MKQRFSVLVMEKYLLGELGDPMVRDFEAELARNPALRETLEAMKSSSRDFLVRFPAERIVPGILDRYAREISMPGKAVPSERASSGFRKRFFFLAPAAAATAVLALLLVLRPWDRGKPNVIGLDMSHDATIIKGFPVVDLKKTQLLVFRRKGDQAEILNTGQSAKEGDLLQLAYVSGAERYGMILSIDGRGQVTLHFPLAPGAGGFLELNTKFLLPTAIELDDAPRFERFFFITSHVPIDEDDVLRRAAVLAADPDRAGREALDLPKDLNQSSLIVYKGKQP